jgi:phage shock protein E
VPPRALRRRIPAAGPRRGDPLHSHLRFAGGALIALLLCGADAHDARLDNPAIDMQGYLRIAKEAAAHRESHRLSEADFIRMSREPGTIVLDARSREMYELLHVKGAVNLSFPDIAVSTLAAKLPDKDARILIYCNNNFENGGLAFLSKAAPASLNLSTYIALYTYGYRNVYELAPLLDVRTSKLEFEGTGVREIVKPGAR